MLGPFQQWYISENKYIINDKYSFSFLSLCVSVENRELGLRRAQRKERKRDGW